MRHVARIPAVNQDASAFLLTESERACDVCGRYPSAIICVSGLDQLMNDTPAMRRDLMQARYDVATRIIDSLPPCDHGALARCRARHARRHTGRE